MIWNVMTDGDRVLLRFVMLTGATMLAGVLVIAFLGVEVLLRITWVAAGLAILLSIVLVVGLLWWFRKQRDKG